MEGDAKAFDEAIFRFVHGGPDSQPLFASEKLLEAFRDMTALGSYAVIGIIVTAVCGYLLLTGKIRAACFILIAVISGVALSHGLKFIFERPRPDLVEAHAQIFTLSFPSAHSTMSAVAYLTLGALLTRLNPSYRSKIYVLGCAALLAVVIGVSRLVLGVHWPTDILAGWAIGAAWALLCWAVFLMLQRRDAMDREG